MCHYVICDLVISTHVHVMSCDMVDHVCMIVVHTLYIIYAIQEFDQLFQFLIVESTYQTDAAFTTEWNASAQEEW